MNFARGSIWVFIQLLCHEQNAIQGQYFRGVIAGLDVRVFFPSLIVEEFQHAMLNLISLPNYFSKGFLKNLIYDFARGINTKWNATSVKQIWKFGRPG